MSVLYLYSIKKEETLYYIILIYIYASRISSARWFGGY